MCLIPFPTKICTYVKHIINLYHPTAGYNKYVELIGGEIGVGACAAVRRGNKIYTIDDDIPLLHFLSGQCFLGSEYIVAIAVTLVRVHVSPIP